MAEVDFEKAMNLLEIIARVVNVMPTATWLQRAASEELKKMEEEFLKAEAAEKGEPEWTPPIPDVRRGEPARPPIYPRGTVTERPNQYSREPLPRLKDEPNAP